MRVNSLTAFVLVVSAACLVGGTPAEACKYKTSGAAKSASAAGTQTVTDAHKSACSTQATAATACSKSASAAFAAVPYHEGRRMELVGRVACGSCDMNSSKDCQAVFQTADGSAYLLLDNSLVEKMRSSSSTGNFRIVTRVRSLSGAKYLDVEAISAL